MPMTRKARVEHLRRVELFAGLSARSLGLLADRAVEITYASGDYVVRQGQVGTGIYLVTSGRVKVVRGGAVLAHLGPGEFFGELSVLDQSPRTAHVVAEEPTTTMGLPSWEFTRLLEKNPRLSLALLRTVARRLRALTDAQQP